MSLQTNFKKILNSAVAEADIVDETDTNYIYCGFQNEGAEETDSSWSIMRIDQSTPGIIKKEWAQGIAKFNHKWSLRDSYSYSHRTF